MRLALLLAGLCVVACTPPKTSSSKPQMTLTHAQALSVLRGCCKGAQGTWNAQEMVCVLTGPSPGRIATAFKGCANRGEPIQFVDAQGTIGHFKARVRNP
jgi:hypothetical protein